MKKGLTEVVFILDRSGSMSGLEADTIGGYNSMLEQQKREEGEAIISTVLFSDRAEVLHDRQKIETVEKLTDREYRVGGTTALLDAIGGAITHIAGVRRDLPKKEQPEKTLFIITTDGMENASREYSYEKIRSLVEKKKKEHWEFLFLGANIDAIEVAGRFGVAANHAVRYECDSEGTALNFNVMSKMVSRVRSCERAEQMEEIFEDDELLAPIQEHYRKAHR